MSILHAAGERIDWRQWLAVSRVLLRLDFRAPLAVSGEQHSLQRVGSLLLMAAVFGGFGLTAAFIIVTTPDARLGALVTLSYLALMLLTTLLSQHGTTLLSADDQRVLGARPVSSRTFFAIRVTNVLFHAGVATLFLGWLPVLAFTFAHGISVARGTAALIAIVLWGATIALTISAGYGTLLRVVRAERVLRLVAYLQMGLVLLGYTAILLSLRIFTGRNLSGLSVTESPWLYLYPPAWFASYLDFASGTATLHSWLRVTLSLLTLLAVGLWLQGKVARDYARGIAERGALDAVDTRPAHTPFFGRREERAVALLVVGHFRHDLRVRVSVLSLAPLVIIYLLLGQQSGPTLDPFLLEGSAPRIDFLAQAMLLFPAVLLRHFSASDAHRASWIYAAILADRGRLVVAARNIALVYFMLPMLALVALLLTWRFGHVGHALAHTAMLGLLASLALQIAVVISPRLPFAAAPDKLSAGQGTFVWMCVVLIGGQLVVRLLEGWVYASWSRTAATMLAVGALVLLLERAVAHRARAAR